MLRLPHRFVFMSPNPISIPWTLICCGTEACGCPALLQSRTYQDLLKNSHDEALFEHYTTSQVVSVKVSPKTLCSRRLAHSAHIMYSSPLPGM